MRFPGFEGEWERRKFDEIFIFSTGKNIKQNEASPEFEIPCVRYGELYHMYDEVINEVVNKTNLDKSELLFSQGDEILLPSAGEDPLDIGSASALTIENVAIGRTINILKPLKPNIYSHIYVAYYINHKLKKDISKLAKGVSISNVYNSVLKTLKINLPSLSEQKIIADLLSLIDFRIEKSIKIIEGLKSFKNAVSKKIFSQELRFKDENGGDFPDWEMKKLGEICKEHLLKNNMNLHNEVFSVAKHKGVINQIEHLGRSFSAKEISHYKLIFHGELVYTKSPTSDFPFGIIKQNRTNRTGVVSPLYCVFRPNAFALGYLLHEYFNSSINTYNYLNPLVQKGAKNTMNINNNDFLNGAPLFIPTDEREQTKIADFLSGIEKKIELETALLQQLKLQKQYFLRQMFI